MVRRLAISVNQAVTRSSLLDDPTGVNRAAGIRAPQANLQVYEYTMLAMGTKRLVSNCTHFSGGASQYEYRRSATAHFIVVPSAAAVIYGATILALGPVHADLGRGISCGGRRCGWRVCRMRARCWGVVDVVAADGDRDLRHDVDVVVVGRCAAEDGWRQPRTKNGSTTSDAVVATSTE